MKPSDLINLSARELRKQWLKAMDTLLEGKHMPNPSKEIQQGQRKLIFNLNPIEAWQKQNNSEVISIIAMAYNDCFDYLEVSDNEKLKRRAAAALKIYNIFLEFHWGVRTKVKKDGEELINCKYDVNKSVSNYLGDAFGKKDG